MKSTSFSQFSAAIVIGLIICSTLASAFYSCAAPSSAQKTDARSAIVRLNTEDIGNSDDLSPLISRLRRTFDQRTQQNFIRFGYEKRTDLPVAQRIEKTVFVKAERSVRLDVFMKVAEAIKQAGADPVSLPVHEGWEKRDWTGRNLDGRLDPFTLAVLLRPTGSFVPLDTIGMESSGDLEISGGIPISISRGSDRESAALLEAVNDGEFKFNGEVVPRLLLIGALRRHFRANPTQTVIEFKAMPETTFAVLEDAYKAAYGAGAKKIRLTISD